MLDPWARDGIREHQVGGLHGFRVPQRKCQFQHLMPAP